jgi:hypothetical protein
MADTIYEVVEKFDSTKDYGSHIRNVVSKCLISFKKGSQLIPKKVIEKNLNKFNKGKAKNIIMECEYLFENKRNMNVV